MAYVKQNFVDGNVLYASELNHIEDGIADAYVKPASGIPTADIANGAVTAAKIAANAVSTLYTATLLANGWEDEGGSVPTYKQVVNVAGILSTDRPTIDLDFSIGTWSRVTQVAVNEEWRVVRAWTGNGTLTVRMSEPPTQDIPIQILCIRK